MLHYGEEGNVEYIGVPKPDNAGHGNAELKRPWNKQYNADGTEGYAALRCLGVVR